MSRYTPNLAPITGEQLNAGAIRSAGARSDVSATCLWVNGQRAFSDIRVYNLYAQRCSTQSVKSYFGSRKRILHTTHFSRQLVELGESVKALFMHVQQC